jgi:hypothetical protein
MDDPRDPMFDPEHFEEVLDAADQTDDADPALTREELAWELVEVLDELSRDELNELVAKNVPRDATEFFERYAGEFCEGLPIAKSIAERLPNLMLLGYLLRVLEDRLLTPEESFDA